MEILKKKRKVMRSQVTRFTNDADKIPSSASAIDLEEVSVLVERLRRRIFLGFFFVGLGVATGPFAVAFFDAENVGVAAVVTVGEGHCVEVQIPFSNPRVAARLAAVIVLIFCVGVHAVLACIHCRDLVHS
ncbi:hypothetical protein HPB52_021323 [Rhipicephalus sanguineus]|uniref:Transmembrane protein n=1 Tax=Rhipicephalus sanguineus TaxID=34632 RepID=A0A9D4PDU2_RHISA|nr:hypothetical protein HPB52_021323 [Rhipicephalus sanguineus]